MIDQASDPLNNDSDALLLAPAMGSGQPPEWTGALWIGAVDLRRLDGFAYLRLQRSEGYDRARLLVREGRNVRGFVELAAPGGLISCRAVEAAASVLPVVLSPGLRGATPWITVIVCTRDRAADLRASLTAILRLDYPTFDVLVVDNAARTAETREMVRDDFADPRVTLISEPAPGLSRARNAGLRHARGEIVAFTDDDVIVDEAWLREIAAGFERAPAAACVTGLVPAGEVRSPSQAYFEGRVNWSKALAPAVYSLADPPTGLPKFPFSPGAFGTGANFALRRETAIAMGGFDTALGAGTRTGGGEDIDMFTRVLLDGHSLVVQPSAVVWHRHRDGVGELRKQARSYSTGLGAWLTKILLTPRMARLAAVRMPGVAWDAMHRVRRAGPPAGEGPELLDPRAAQLARLLNRERWSVARGPVTYLLERRTQAREAA